MNTTTTGSAMSEQTNTVSTESEEAPLTFELLHAERAECQCFDRATVEPGGDKAYMRRAHQKDIHEDDFKTYWELYDEEQKAAVKKCEKVAGCKGLSVDLIDQRAQDLLEEYHDKWQHARNGYTRYIHQFRMHPSTGLVDTLHTSPKKPNHRNIWKGDSFNVDRLIKIDTIDLANV